MENLRKFNTQEEYQEWKDGDDYVYPSVCKVGDEVVYNDYPEPFWIEVLEDVIVKCSLTENSTTHYTAVKYSIDKQNWNTFTEGGVVLRTGKKLYLQYKIGNANTYLKYLKLDVSGRFNVGGSIASLEFGADYLNNDKSHSFVRFSSLFTNARSIINAKDLILINSSSTTGNTATYSGMFHDCSLLETAPRLPRNSVANGFFDMFNSCSSLTKAPTLFNNGDIQKEELTQMFFGCSKLSYIKMLYTGAFGSDASLWVKGVSPTGTFIANSNRTDFTRGISGIPEGWDLYLYDVDNDRYVVKFKVNDIPYEYYTDEPRDVTWQEFIDSEQNTNNFYSASNHFPYHPIRSKNGYVLLDGNYVTPDDKIILNTSYTIGQPTETTEE